MDPGLPSEAICHRFPTTGTSLLHVATASNMTNVTEKLAAKDRGVMEVDDIGDAALHSAAQYGYIPGGEILLKNGAYCVAKSRSGRTPLVAAAIRVLRYFSIYIIPTSST
jgi:ankyrin repeat protein